jgi:hypothetical protein
VQQTTRGIAALLAPSSPRSRLAHRPEEIRPYASIFFLERVDTVRHVSTDTRTQEGRRRPNPRDHLRLRPLRQLLLLGTFFILKIILDSFVEILAYCQVSLLIYLQIKIQIFSHDDYQYESWYGRSSWGDYAPLSSLSDLYFVRHVQSGILLSLLTILQMF